MAVADVERCGLVLLLSGVNFFEDFGALPIVLNTKKLLLTVPSLFEHQGRWLPFLPCSAQLKNGTHAIFLVH